jgi:hypothetical protein
VVDGLRERGMISYILDIYKHMVTSLRLNPKK